MQDLDYTRHDGSVSYNYRVCTYILLPSFLNCQNSGIIRVVCAQRGPLISVVLPLHIAKTEKRWCSVILVKGTLQFHCYLVLIVMRKWNTLTSRGNFTLIHLLSTFSKNDPWLMYENIDTCWVIWNKFLPLLNGGWVGQYCPSFRENVETFWQVDWVLKRWRKKMKRYMPQRLPVHADGALFWHKKKLIASKTNRPI